MKVDRIRSNNPILQANMYVLVDDDHYGIIDACHGTGYERLIRTLGNRRPQWVFLTHWHCDHVGWLARLLADYDYTPTVYCTEESAPFITGQKHWRESYFYQVSGPPLTKLFWSFAFRVWPIEPVHEVTVVKPGDTLALGAESWQVMALPGHTLNHVGLYHAGRRALFSGDAISLNRHGHLRKSLDMLAEDTRLLAETFERVKELDLEVIYPGHFGCGVVLDDPQ